MVILAAVLAVPALFSLQPFSDKYKLERHTLELVELSKRISALVEEFQSKYPVR